MSHTLSLPSSVHSCFILGFLSKHKHFKNFNATVCSYIVLCEYIYLLSIQLHSDFFFQKESHYLPKGLIFNALVENREKQGVRGSERVASHTRYTR